MDKAILSCSEISVCALNRTFLSSKDYNLSVKTNNNSIVKIYYYNLGWHCYCILECISFDDQCVVTSLSFSLEYVTLTSCELTSVIQLVKKSSYKVNTEACNAQYFVYGSWIFVISSTQVSFK